LEEWSGNEWKARSLLAVRISDRGRVGMTLKI
jgi:hypothetical protein